LLIKRKKLWRNIFAVFIVSLIVLSLVQPSSAATLTPVNGKLTQGGTPLSAVTFSIHDGAGNWFDATTDNQGNFTFQVPDASYTLDGVWVDTDKKWYPLSNNNTFTVTGGALVGMSAFNVDIPTLSSTQNVSGTITKNGTPLSGITFSVHTAGTATPQWYDATSDANGSFKLSLPDGAYQLDGVWVGAESKWYPLNKAFTVAGTLSLPIEVLPPGVGVTGSVTKDGAGLANQIFSVHTTDASNTWYDIQTDVSGKFTANLPDNSYQVDGIWVASESHWYPLTNQTFTVANGAGSLNIALTSAFNITGTLTKGTAAVPNNWVSIHDTKSGQWYDAQTDANGAFKFSLPDGNYQLEGVWVSTESKWYPLSQSFTVSGGKINNSSTLNIDVLAAPTPNVTISITKAQYNVTDALISAQSKGADQTWYNAQNDGNGKYSFTLPDGSYHIDGVWVQLDNKWYTNKLDFDVVNGQVVSTQPLTIDVSVVPGNVKGQLVNGTPINNNVISAHTVGANPVWYNAQTDALGNFIFDLPDGDYQIDGIWVASENKWYPNIITFTVTGGQLQGQTQLLIDLQTKPNVSGTVTIANSPANLASLSILNTDTSQYYYTGTDQNGKYAIQLPDGNYMVETIFTADYQTIYVNKNFSVVNGKITVNGAAANTLDIAPPNVQGTVNDANVPVANATVAILDYSTGGTTNATTDANGVFSIDLPDGNYSIDSVNVNGSNIYIYTDFTITNHIVYVNGLAQNQFTLNLPPVVAQGDVTADGAPLADGTVWFYNLTTSSWARADIGTNGQFSLRLPDGDYQVDSVDSTALSNTVYLNTAFNVTNGVLTAGGKTLSQLHVVLPSEVKGSVVDGNNNPLGGYTVNIEDANFNYISTLTAADGSFGVRLQDGTYTVTDVMDPNGNSIAVNKTFTVTGGKLANANDLALTAQ
jgi:hypothetical protein